MTEGLGTLCADDWKGLAALPSRPLGPRPVKIVGKSGVGLAIASFLTVLPLP